MSVKIRLARRGRKKMPIYDIVVADSRSPRDGRFIEKIGQYNPHATPAGISLKSDRAIYWLMVGAQPTDTTRKIPQLPQRTLGLAPLRDCRLRKPSAGMVNIPPV